MKWLLTGLSILLSFLAGAQKPLSGDSSANFITYWRKGDTRTYSILHEKQSPSPDGKNAIFHFAYEARVDVLDASDSDYTVKWVFHLPPGASKGQKDSLPGFDGMQMIFRVSNTGGFLELINWEEVRDIYSRIMSFPTEAFNSRHKVEGSLIREIQLVHLPYGYTFTTEKVSSNTQLSNPFGGSPLPAIQSYQITSFDPAQFTLVIDQHIDKTKLTGTLDALLKKVTDPRQRLLKKEQLSALELSDYSEYRITRYTGWLRHLFYKREAIGGGIIQSDAYTIELKE
jgi:hypothetical protein